MFGFFKVHKEVLTKIPITVEGQSNYKLIQLHEGVKTLLHEAV